MPPPLNAVPASLGLDDYAIDAIVASLGEGGIPASVRHAALGAYRALPAPGPPPGRYWKIDVSTIDLEHIPAFVDEPMRPVPVERAANEAARFEQTDLWVNGVDVDPTLNGRGLVVCDFATALREYPSAIAWVNGSAVDWQSQKFAALNAAFRYGGACIVIPKDMKVEEPVVVRYRAVETALFPYTLVIAGEGSAVTVISRLEGGAFENALVSEIVEVIAQPGASVCFASSQRLDEHARVFATRRAKIGQDAEVRWAIAELGAGLSVGNVRSIVEQRGVQTSISGIFFADGEQHVDLQSEVEHVVGNTQSETLFKSAATGRGQARFVGNIRIHPHAHGSEATLRDDALILSKGAHIDSIPALEIGANDVKAYHGATVGAISEDEVFYATTRGIERGAAERMIALGFFEPAILRFPTSALQDELREVVAEKIG